MPQGHGDQELQGCPGARPDTGHQEEAHPVLQCKYDPKLGRGMAKTSPKPYKNCFWSQIIFSDEKRFSLFNDRPIQVWRRRVDKYKQGCTREQKKFSKSIIVHLMIKHNRQARLTRCDNRQDSSSYQTVVLQPNLNFIRRVDAQDCRNPTVYQHELHPTPAWQPSSTLGTTE